MRAARAQGQSSRVGSRRFGPGFRGSVVVLLAALIAGCAIGSTTSRPVTVPTAGPTPTLAPARPLDWQAHQPPVALGSASQWFNGGLAVAQGDGATAYVCSLEGAAQGHMQVWATHDRATHWARVSDVVSTGPIQTCYLVVDDLQPTTVVALACAPDTELGSYCAASSSYVTLDGGATWQAVSGPLPHFHQLATYGGVSYSLTATPPHSACFDCTDALAVSRDGLRTWTRIDHAITAAGRFASRFWLEPASGALLVETSNHYVLQNELWLTTDSGAHWSRTPNPVVDSYFVRPLLSGVPWSACGNHSGTSSDHPTYPSLLECSRDGGRTWRQTGGPYVNPGLAFPIVVAVDGSILAQWYVPGASPGAPARFELRRLPPAGAGWGASWEPLGPVPALGSLTYAAGSGVLWLSATNTGNGSPQGALYTAMYP